MQHPAPREQTVSGIIEASLGRALFLEIDAKYGVDLLPLIRCLDESNSAQLSLDTYQSDMQQAQAQIDAALQALFAKRLKYEFVAVFALLQSAIVKRRTRSLEIHPAKRKANFELLKIERIELIRLQWQLLHGRLSFCTLTAEAFPEVAEMVSCTAIDSLKAFQMLLSDVPGQLTALLDCQFLLMLCQKLSDGAKTFYSAQHQRLGDTKAVYELGQMVNTLTAVRVFLGEAQSVGLLNEIFDIHHQSYLDDAYPEHKTSTNQNYRALVTAVLSSNPNMCRGLSVYLQLKTLECVIQPDAKNTESESQQIEQAISLLEGIEEFRRLVEHSEVIAEPTRERSYYVALCCCDVLFKYLMDAYVSDLLMRCELVGIALELVLNTPQRPIKPGTYNIIQGMQQVDLVQLQSRIASELIKLYRAREEAEVKAFFLEKLPLLERLLIKVNPKSSQRAHRNFASEPAHKYPKFAITGLKKILATFKQLAREEQCDDGERSERSQRQAHQKTRPQGRRSAPSKGQKARKRRGQSASRKGAKAKRHGGHSASGHAQKGQQRRRQSSSDRAHMAQQTKSQHAQPVKALNDSVQQQAAARLSKINDQLHSLEAVYLGSSPTFAKTQHEVSVLLNRLLKSCSPLLISKLTITEQPRWQRLRKRLQSRANHLAQQYDVRKFLQVMMQKRESMRRSSSDSSSTIHRYVVSAPKTQVERLLEGPLKRFKEQDVPQAPKLTNQQTAFYLDCIHRYCQAGCFSEASRMLTWVIPKFQRGKVAFVGLPALVDEIFHSCWITQQQAQVVLRLAWQLLDRSFRHDSQGQVIERHVTRRVLVMALHPSSKDPQAVIEHLFSELPASINEPDGDDEQQVQDGAVIMPINFFKLWLAIQYYEPSNPGALVEKLKYLQRAVSRRLSIKINVSVQRPLTPEIFEQISSWLVEHQAPLQQAGIFREAFHRLYECANWQQHFHTLVQLTNESSATQALAEPYKRSLQVSLSHILGQPIMTGLFAEESSDSSRRKHLQSLLQRGWLEHSLINKLLSYARTIHASAVFQTVLAYIQGLRIKNLHQKRSRVSKAIKSVSRNPGLLRVIAYDASVLPQPIETVLGDLTSRYPGQVYISAGFGLQVNSEQAPAVITAVPNDAELIVLSRETKRLPSTIYHPSASKKRAFVRFYQGHSVQVRFFPDYAAFARVKHFARETLIFNTLFLKSESKRALQSCQSNDLVLSRAGEAVVEQGRARACLKLLIDSFLKKCITGQPVSDIAQDTVFNWELQLLERILLYWRDSCEHKFSLQVNNTLHHAFHEDTQKQAFERYWFETHRTHLHSKIAALSEAGQASFSLDDAVKNFSELGQYFTECMYPTQSQPHVDQTASVQQAQVVQQARRSVSEALSERPDAPVQQSVLPPRWLSTITSRKKRLASVVQLGSGLSVANLRYIERWLQTQWVVSRQPFAMQYQNLLLGLGHLRAMTFSARTEVQAYQLQIKQKLSVQLYLFFAELPEAAVLGKPELLALSNLANILADLQRLGVLVSLPILNVDTLVSTLIQHSATTQSSEALKTLLHYSAIIAPRVRGFEGLATCFDDLLEVASAFSLADGEHLALCYQSCIWAISMGFQQRSPRKLRVLLSHLEEIARFEIDNATPLAYSHVFNAVMHMMTLVWHLDAQNFLKESLVKRCHLDVGKLFALIAENALLDHHQLETLFQGVERLRLNNAKFSFDEHCAPCLQQILSGLLQVRVEFTTLDAFLELVCQLGKLHILPEALFTRDILDVLELYTRDAWWTESKDVLRRFLFLARAHPAEPSAFSCIVYTSEMVIKVAAAQARVEANGEGSQVPVLQAEQTLSP